MFLMPMMVPLLIMGSHPPEHRTTPKHLWPFFQLLFLEHFFDEPSDRILIDCSSILGPTWAPKSTKIDIFFDDLFDQFFDWFLVDFYWIWEPTWAPKSIKNRLKSSSKYYAFWDPSCSQTVINFWSNFSSSWRGQGFRNTVKTYGFSSNLRVLTEF